MYVCICKAVTAARIQGAVEDGARSLDELRERLGVATGCGGCAPVITSFLPCSEPDSGAGARVRPYARGLVPASAGAG